ncbi:3-phosphoserine/phosphohydroxythreonine transaminase [Myroides marinus]|uniref:3-phosphoserine/phosphohydroxythreonine transaminase n=1 Tax=Myroides marinus TaxID=703342 RepID=UPI000741EF73|nr:3-phosphoserine/phosphohydroxythreonine transaminase [Myroides marinus]KUF40264.1 3-phosphoserine/phosphohydroxythreonine aminotransferase [Myroides marinus]MDM1368657.1 3-phosphoserine/phosphohydroxythreonine transaminase [Myroides marinus]MDM1375751.1 3-phosphoserine/phosphohydroxythreonine transaminase [Myroides marinus]MDM1381855.1 3-phosphoserine/phosphohydroxythreonine transaminase [Myroides marinus]MDM1501314.1 3-phosphoserine/phosphohydroxythreonine transaminase [Myroides marinus]
MSKVHNFCAGPCLLPDEVYRGAAEAVIDFNGSGLSILSISHRSKEFIAVLEEAQHLALSLFGLEGKGYSALFLQGGASMEFLRVPYNLMKTKAGYVDTGNWSSKAIAQAQAFGEVNVLASSKDRKYAYIPEGIVIPRGLDYVHYTSNNTIYGTQYRDVPQADCPIVCDMSSDIYSRVYDCDKIDLIYAGAQKNIGPAGLSVVLVRDSILGKSGRVLPQMMDYAEHIDKGSLYHTANVFAIYTSLLNLRWLDRLGGVEAIEKINNQKATTLYRAIDDLDYVVGLADVDYRSKMNVTFDFKEEQMKGIFDTMCAEANITNIKGHRVAGGYRASLYNALTQESVDALVGVLHEMKSKI